MSGQQCPKRRRYCLSLKKPTVTVHQNIKLEPAPGYDEEGKLPKSLPPTPIVDLVTTEDESEVERTPQRYQQPHRPSMQELNPEEIEQEEGDQVFQPPPPPLQPLRRGGKNMATVLASVREVSPTPSMNDSPPASPVLGEDTDILRFVEEETRRLERTKLQMERAAPNLKRKLDESRTREADLRLQIAALERQVQEEESLQQQLNAALQAVERFTNV